MFCHDIAHFLKDSCQELHLNNATGLRISLWHGDGAVDATLLAQLAHQGRKHMNIWPTV